MITRHEAEVQAEHCFEYHAAFAAGIVGMLALVDRRVLPAVGAALATGVAVHAACLFGIPAARESILRSTASMMEDIQHSRLQNSERMETAASR